MTILLVLALSLLSQAAPAQEAGAEPQSSILLSPESLDFGKVYRERFGKR